MAYAGARFANSILEAIVLGKPVTECTYVNSDVAAADGLEYFSTEVEFGVSHYSDVCLWFVFGLCEMFDKAFTRNLALSKFTQSPLSLIMKRNCTQLLCQN